MSTMKVLDKDYSHWVCARCEQPLQPATVELEYLDSLFNVELPACAACGLVLIPEDLATGKMADVESLLEDK
ncbi:DVU_1557 family redox protein [Oleidesulfovibrio alaskensis]